MMTGMVEEALSVGTLVSLFHFYSSRNSLCSAVLPSVSPVLGIPLEEITWPQGVLLCAVMRESEAVLPAKIKQLEPADQLLFLIPDERTEAREELSGVLFETATSQPTD